MNQPKTTFANGINPFAGIMIPAKSSFVRKKVKGMTANDETFWKMRVFNETASVSFEEFDSFKKQIRRHLHNHNLSDQFSVRQRKDGRAYHLWLEPKVKQ